MNDNNRPLLLRLGQAQIDAMFARQDEGLATDDSEFLPLVEAVLTAYEKAEINETVAEDLWSPWNEASLSRLTTRESD